MSIKLDNKSEGLIDIDSRVNDRNSTMVFTKLEALIRKQQQTGLE